MPEPIPLGLTFLLAMIRATVSASFVKVPFGGNVETVVTSRTQYVLSPFFPAMVPPALAGGLHGFVKRSECEELRTKE
jgi:hypothetical protein